jgi:hypothetical protein
MTTTCSLTIDFREGFYDDTVIVLIDGNEVFRKANITSKTMTGFAEAITVKLESGNHNLHVKLLEKEVSQKINLEIHNSLYLGLNYKPEKGLEYKLQGEPFRYM